MGVTGAFMLFIALLILSSSVDNVARAIEHQSRCGCASGSR